MAGWTLEDHARFKKLTKDFWARGHEGATLEELRRGHAAMLQDFQTMNPDFAPGSGKVSVADAYGAFQNFCDGVLARRVVESRAEYLEVTMTRNYGKVTMSWKMGATFNITSTASRSAAYDEVYSEINTVAVEWERKHLGAALPGQPVQQPLVEADETFITERLEVEVKGGKSYVKVTGGKYQKHGVRVWPEVLEAAGILVADLTSAGLDIPGYTARVEMRNGRPIKVVGLSKNV